jgi:ATP-binding cassette subfamily F protein 3
MVLITHDRHLIRQVATRIIEVVDGRVRSFDGDYEYYMEKTQAEAAPEAKPPATKTSKREEAEARQARSRAKSAVRRVEEELERAHSEMETLGALLSDPDFYTKGDEIGDAVREYERLQNAVIELEDEWERLTSEMA